MWLFMVASLLLTTMGFFIYQEVRGIVFSAADKSLHEEIGEIAGLIRERDGKIELIPSGEILGDYTLPLSGRYYKVLMDGTLLSASPSLVDRSFDLAAGAQQSRDASATGKTYTSVGPAGEPIRVLWQDRETLGRTFSIFAAEDFRAGIRMVRTVRNLLFLLIFSGIAIVCLTGFSIAKWSLAPLNVFSRRIGEITHKTLGRKIDATAETREISDLAHAFNEMLDRLQKVFEGERRFIADASHELRTPVSVIKAQCDVVLQKERSTEEYIMALRAIRSVNDNIGDLVRDLLALSRLDSGILSPEGFTAFSLNDSILKWADVVRPLAAQRGIRIVTRVGADVTITGDRDRLGEAFLNIMENGLKYNRENGLLDVSSGTDGGNAVVSVRDTGIGIGKADIERVFDRFYRADISRGDEGTGLGLSIARAIIEAHGGEIKLESAEGKGTHCTVVLPAGGRTEENPADMPQDETR